MNVPFEALRRKVKSFLFGKVYKKQLDVLHDTPLPENEEARLAALKGLNILDTPPEERFDRVTRITAKMLDVPISFITLVDANRQWFKSCYGTQLEDTDKKVSFCAYAIVNKDLFVIPDTKKDPRFREFPVVTGVANIRFYAGQPIAAPNGQLVGTLCILDHKPRNITEEERRNLKDLAAWAELEINNRQLGNALEARKELVAKLEQSEAALEEKVKERTRSLTESLEENKELEEVRDRVIRIISHQLRTPLNAIRWNLESMLSDSIGTFSPEQKEFLRMTYSSEVEVINRLHDLLEALDIRERRVRFDDEVVDLVSTWEAVMAQWLPKVKAKNIEMKFTAPTDAIPSVKADATKVRIVMDRLMNNAVSYTQEGGTVEVYFVNETGKVRFVMKDTGIGIPEQEKRRVFTPFFRAANAYTVQADASGLGLYISKYYVENMRGAMNYESAEGKGSTFWFELPIVR